MNGPGTEWRAGYITVQANDPLTYVRNFLSHQGLTQSPEPVKNNQHIFCNEKTRAAVKILTCQTFGSRSELLEALAKAIDSKRNSNLTYLAIPKIYATIIDCQILQEQGIGLLSYNEKSIEQLVPPKVFENINNNPNLTPPSIELLEQIHELRNRIENLEQEISTLYQEVKSLPRKFSPSLTSHLETHTGVKLANNLPEFAKENPWLEVLAQRGKSDAGLPA